MSYAPNLLIKQGAKLVHDWNDVVTELKPEERRWLADRFRKQLNLNEAESESENPASSGPMNDVSRSVLAALTFDDPVQLDSLVTKLEPHSASEVLATLFALECNGMIRQLPGKCYIRVWGG
jgi:DNA processing protein